MKYFLCFVLCLISFLGGCTSDKKSAPTQGRISVSGQLLPTIINQKSSDNIVIGEGQIPSLWSQSGVTGQNLIPHVIAGNNLKQVWSTNIGDGLSDDRWTMAQPIVANGIIYALDASFNLSAIRLDNGKKVWKKELPLSHPTSIRTVGLAYSYDKLFAVSGNGTVVCTDLKGKVVWSKNLKLPLRSVPTIYRNKIYLLTADNQLVLLDTKNGEEVWHYKSMPVDTNLLGMGTPAMYKKYAVVPFSNGEVITFDTNDESALWTEYLSSARSFNRISELTHILASPVIEDGVVYLVGNAGKMGAYRLNDGKAVWTQPMGGNSTPSLSTNALFFINNQNVLIAMDKNNGKIFWNTTLTSHKQDESANWNGPLLVNNQVIVVSSLGDIVFIDIKTGAITRHDKTDGIITAPISVDKTVLFLTEDADLLAYR